MSERSNAASEKKTYTLRAKPCSSEESWGKSKVNEPAQNRNLLSKTRRYGNLRPRNQRFKTTAPPALSNAFASCKTRPSQKVWPKICKPTGNPSDVFPQGTEIPGTPASDPVTVYMSA